MGWCNVLASGYSHRARLRWLVVFRWAFVLRVVFGVDCGKHFVSSGRMCVEVLGPTVNLMSDKIAYCTSITDSVIGG